MKKIAIFLIILVFTVFASTQRVGRSSEFGFSTDTTGGASGDSAFVYAVFCVSDLAFSIVNQDVWSCSMLNAGEDTFQTIGPLVYANKGAVSLDLGFGVLDADVERHLWTNETISLTPPTVPNKYVLALILTDNTVAGSSLTRPEWQNNDILTATTRFYSTDAVFDATTDARSYEHEGATSLNLWAGPPGENQVNSFFRIIMSLAGSSDMYAHAAKIGVYARISVD